MISKSAAGVSAPGSCCPDWCTDHIGDLHQHRLGRLGGQLQVVIERQDQDGLPGRLQLSFRFCSDGELIDDSAEFSLDQILDTLTGDHR